MLHSTFTLQHLQYPSHVPGTSFQKSSEIWGGNAHQDLSFLGGKFQQFHPQTLTSKTSCYGTFALSVFTPRARNKVRGKFAEDPRVWRRVADVPVYDSTCTTLCGQLLAVSGENNDSTDSDAVYMYDPTKNTWNIISSMPTADCSPLVAPLPGNKFMVVCRDIVFIASVVH